MTDPLAAAREALARYDRVHARERDEDDPSCLACDTTLSLRDECEWPGDGPLCDSCADDERVAFRDGLRAVIAACDEPHTATAPLPHEWPADPRDPRVCTHGCGCEPGDVLIEDECPRRPRATVAHLEAELDAPRLAHERRGVLLEGAVRERDRLRAAARAVVAAWDRPNALPTFGAAVDGLRDALAGREKT